MHADKYESFLQVDTNILGVVGQGNYYICNKVFQSGKFCVLLWCKILRYFIGVQSCLLLLVLSYLNFGNAVLLLFVATLQYLPGFSVTKSSDQLKEELKLLPSFFLLDFLTSQTSDYSLTHHFTDIIF